MHSEHKSKRRNPFTLFIFFFFSMPAETNSTNFFFLFFNECIRRTKCVIFFHATDDNVFQFNINYKQITNEKIVFFFLNFISCRLDSDLTIHSVLRQRRTVSLYCQRFVHFSSFNWIFWISWGNDSQIFSPQVMILYRLFNPFRWYGWQ